MKIKVTESFFAVLAIMIALNGMKLFFFIMFTCIAHELAHLLCMLLFKFKIQEISITCIGGRIRCAQDTLQSDIKWFFVYISGVVVNFLLGYLCYCIACNGFFSRNFFILSGINFLFAIFNSLPIKILDGYFIIKYFLSIFCKNERVIILFCDFLSVLCNVLLILYGVYLAINFNFSVLIIAIYLWFSIKSEVSIF